MTRPRCTFNVLARRLLAGRHVRKLSFGRRNDPVLEILRRVLREARKGATREKYCLGQIGYRRIDGLIHRDLQAGE